MIPDLPFQRCLSLLPDSVVDGDTLRLADPAPEAWGAMLGRLRLASDGAVLVRLAALDAPESDYPAGQPLLGHQPAAAVTLSLALLHEALWRGGEARCTLEVRAIDRYGRAVALLWPGAQAGCLEDSLNARLLASGAAYPDLHADLPVEALGALGALARAARRAGRGLWPLDRSAQGVALDDLAALRDRDLVLPRLFRRLADFWRSQGAAQAVTGTATGAVTGAVTGTVTGAVTGATTGATTSAIGDWPFREFLEQRERNVRLGAGGPLVSFASQIEVAQGRCRVIGEVENFLYQPGQASEKLT